MSFLVSLKNQVCQNHGKADLILSRQPRFIHMIVMTFHSVFIKK
ncbi:hypothetical protein GECvBMG_gp095c [Salmonella phage GEC_vB_MG]|nr:hypothetical protein GECvBMG_gp095c [Salmonella phage GEC_vB_MG]